MEWITSINGIVTILSTLTVGGIIGSIISLKYKGRVENAKAGQEEAKVDQVSAEADLKEEQVRQLKFGTTEKAISIYDRALEVLRAENEADKKERDVEREKWHKKLEELNQKITVLTVLVENQKSELEKKDKAISDMTKAQLKLKLELDLVRVSMTDNCESCSFKHACEKYNAKCLMSEDETK